MKNAIRLKKALLLLPTVVVLMGDLAANECEEECCIRTIRPIPMRHYRSSEYQNSDVKATPEDDITWPSKYNQDEDYEQFTK